MRRQLSLHFQPTSSGDTLEELRFPPDSDPAKRLLLLNLHAVPGPQHQQLEKERRSRLLGSLTILSAGPLENELRKGVADLLREILKLQHLVLLFDRLELPPQQTHSHPGIS